MPGILVVEDEPDLASLIAFNLTQAHFQVEIAHNGESALERASAHPPGLVVLDLMLPDMSGLEVCRQIRERAGRPYVPVLILTARREETDRVAGFESGADDYMTKPFSVQELVLRVKAILRRSASLEEDSQTLGMGILEVDAREHRCLVEGRAVLLTLLEFRLLHFLMKHTGKVQSRETLLEEVWKLQGSLETRTIDTHINRLRQKLGEARDYLETVRGIGYRISAPGPKIVSS